jgi:hypothetical protein
LAISNQKSERIGAAHCGEYRETAGAVGEVLPAKLALKLAVPTKFRLCISGFLLASLKA